MRRSTKPCPGCGEVKSHRATNEICLDCTRLLRLGREVEKERAVQPQIVRAEVPPAGWEHWLPSLGILRTDDQKLFGKSFCKLARSMNRGTHSNFGIVSIVHGSGDHYSGWDFIYLKEDDAIALREIWATVKSMLWLAHREGKQDGRDLLGQIARGELSIEEINKATIAAK